tara:strand:+ start:1138 stop:1731 length:594 start_codon:yes stop_codon:yes gene_type:complete
MASKIIVNDIEHSSGSSTAVAMAKANITNLDTTNISSGTIGSSVIFPNQHVIRYGFSPLASTSAALTSTGSTDLVSLSVNIPAAYNYIFIKFDFAYKISGNSTSVNPYGYWSIVDVTDTNAVKSKVKVKHVLPANSDTVEGIGTVSAYWQTSQANVGYSIKTTQTWGAGSIQTMGSNESDQQNPTAVTIHLIQGAPS